MTKELNETKSGEKAAVEPSARVSFLTELQDGAKFQVRMVPSADEHPKGAGTADAKACRQSMEYRDFINTAAENMFDLKALGDLRSLISKHDCQIKTTADAIRFAEVELSKTGDRYNHILSKQEVKAFADETSGRFGGIGVFLVSTPERGSLASAVAAAAGAAVATDRNARAAAFSAGLNATTSGSAEQAKAKDVSQTAATDTSAANTSKQHSFARIDEVIRNTPAEKVGLLKGDVITHVNGKSVRDMDPEQVGNLLRGRLNSQVSLNLIRDGHEIHRDIRRGMIDANTVGEPSDKGDGVIYIRIRNFHRSDTAEKVQAALEKNPSAKGFVIDVRNNPGGLVDAAVDTSALFIERGTIMRTRERVRSTPEAPVFAETHYYKGSSGTVAEVTYSDGRTPELRKLPSIPDVIKGRPVVVLTDNDTASAGEIFAGASHDSGKNVSTLGVRTYGKGIGQSIFPLMPGGTNLKVTDMRYYTPSGKWPGDADKQRPGLEPDKTVANPENVDFNSPEDAQLIAGVELVKEKLKRPR